jgi:hypothetical protein
VFRNVKKIICVLLSIKIHCFFAFFGIQHDINQLKKGPTEAYRASIISRDDYIHVASNT